MTRPKHTTGRGRRVAENVAMAGLMVASRAALRRLRIQDVVALSGKASSAMHLISRARAKDDTVARARALAYRWSDIVPGTNCLHRAISTRVWLAAFHLPARVVLGVRRREVLEGHAWLEVYLENTATLLFVEDDGYETELPL